jgi:hypothetical protein
MSLPARLGITDLSEFSAPYLKAPRPQTDSPTEAAHHTRARRRIGFVWRGNPQHKNDRRRSRPILEFAQHLPTHDADWVSLQVGGDVAGELNLLRTQLKTAAAIGHPTIDEDGWLPHIEDAGNRFEDLLDTARAITTTDHVITVDTAVAHLAGAQGHPTTLLLPDPPDWRWGIPSKQTIWYSNHYLIPLVAQRISSRHLRQYPSSILKTDV